MRKIVPRKFDGVLFKVQWYVGGSTVHAANTIVSCYADGLRVRAGDKMVPYDGSTDVDPMWIIRGTMNGTGKALKILTDGETWYKIDYLEDLRNDEDMELTTNDQYLVQVAIGMYHGAKASNAT